MTITLALSCPKNRRKDGRTWTRHGGAAFGVLSDALLAGMCGTILGCLSNTARRSPNKRIGGVNVYCATNCNTCRMIKPIGTTEYEERYMFHPTWIINWISVFLHRLWKPWGTNNKRMTLRQTFIYAKTAADILKELRAAKEQT